MADDDIPTNEGSQGRQRPLNVEETDTGRVQFTRHNISTGEMKEMQNELLEEVCKCIDDQTETIGGQLESIRKDLERSRNLQPSRVFFNNKFNELAKALGGGLGGGSSGGGGSDDETSRILKSMLTNLEHITSHTANIGGAAGGGGEGDGGGGTKSEGLDMADILSTERSVESLRDFIEAIEQTSPLAKQLKEQYDQIVGNKKQGILGKFAKRLQEGNIGLGAFVEIFQANVLIELRETLNTVVDNFSRLSRNLASFDIQMNKATGVMTENMEMASAGIASAFEDLIIGELVNLFDPLNDSLKRTSRLLRENAGNLTSIIVTSERGIENQAEFFQTVRDQIMGQGFNFRARMSDDEANQAIIQMADLMKRSNIREELTRGSVAAQTRKQLEFFSLIADNTGRTVDELVKANKETFKNVSELAAAGIIRPDQLEGYMSLSALTEDRPGLQRLIAAMAESGGYGAFASLNRDLYTSLSQMGAQDELRGLFDLVERRGAMGDEEFTNAANRFFNQMRLSADEAGLGPQARAISGIGAIKDILADAATITSEFRDNLDEGETTLQGMWNWLKNFKANVLDPIGDLFSVFASVFNVGVMSAHTMAMIAHTAALKGNSIGGMLKGGLGKAGGMLKGGMAAAGTAAGTAGLWGLGAGAGFMGGMAIGQLIDNAVGWIRDDERNLSSLIGEAAFNWQHGDKVNKMLGPTTIEPPRTNVSSPNSPNFEAKVQAEGLEKKADEQNKNLRDINNTLREIADRGAGPRRASPGAKPQTTALDQGSLFGGP